MVLHVGKRRCIKLYQLMKLLVRNCSRNVLVQCKLCFGTDQQVKVSVNIMKIIKLTFFVLFIFKAKLFSDSSSAL